MFRHIASRVRRNPFSLACRILAAAILLASVSARAGEITIYSGRSKNLVQPILDSFQQHTGIRVNVRYGGTSEMAATLLEEGRNSPADVFFSQDAGALGAVAAEGLLAKLPEEVLARVPERLRSRDGFWVGTSGRIRVLAYSTKLKESELPSSVLELTAPGWKGRVGWAPANGSFQAFVTAMRVKLGEDRAREWLKAMKAVSPKAYPNNSSIVAALGQGEIEVGLVNHYYLLNFLREKGEDFPVRNHYLKGGDVGGMMNVAGVGILSRSKDPASARSFVEYLLSPEVQSKFVEGADNEYPLVEGVPVDSKLPPLASLELPEIDLGSVNDLRGTLEMLQDLGILE